MPGRYVHLIQSNINNEEGSLVTKINKKGLVTLILNDTNFLKIN